MASRCFQENCQASQLTAPSHIVFFTSCTFWFLQVAKPTKVERIRRNDTLPLWQIGLRKFFIWCIPEDFNSCGQKMSGQTSHAKSATAALELQNHQILMVFFASAPRLRASRWVMVHRSRSPADSSLWMTTITSNSSNKELTTTTMMTTTITTTTTSLSSSISKN